MPVELNRQHTKQEGSPDGKPCCGLHRRLPIGDEEREQGRAAEGGQDVILPRLEEKRLLAHQDVANQPAARCVDHADEYCVSGDSPVARAFCAPTTAYTPKASASTAATGCLKCRASGKVSAA